MVTLAILRIIQAIKRLVPFKERVALANESVIVAIGRVIQVIGRVILALERFILAIERVMVVIYTGCLFYSLHTLNYHRIEGLNRVFLSLSGILLQGLCIHDNLIWQLEFDCMYDCESCGNPPTFAQSLAC